MAVGAAERKRLLQISGLLMVVGLVGIVYAVVAELATTRIEPTVKPDSELSIPAAAEFSGCDPEQYYALVGDLNNPGSIPNLKSALHNLIDNHAIIPYSSSSQIDATDALKDLDENPNNPNEVLPLYRRSKPTPKSAYVSGSAENSWNKEHTWPKSRGVGKSGADTSDLFNLYISNARLNSARGNKLFGECSPCNESPAAAGSVLADPTSGEASNFWQPPEGMRGNIARAMFYMAVRYDGSDSATTDLEISECSGGGSCSTGFGDLSTLIKWHNDDPVDAEEIKRVDKICSKYQGNRNPFVDYPNLVAFVFGGSPVPAPTPTAKPSPEPTIPGGVPTNSPTNFPTIDSQEPNTGSCSGFCGGKSDGTCWCNSACKTYDDCCSNYEEICLGQTSPTSPPTLSGSCSGTSCSGKSAGDCYCSSDCVDYNDCCSDYESVCLTNPTPAPVIQPTSNPTVTAAPTQGDVPTRSPTFRRGIDQCEDQIPSNLQFSDGTPAPCNVLAPYCSTYEIVRERCSFTCGIDCAALANSVRPEDDEISAVQTLPEKGSSTEFYALPVGVASAAVLAVAGVAFFVIKRRATDEGIQQELKVVNEAGEQAVEQVKPQLNNTVNPTFQS